MAFDGRSPESADLFPTHAHHAPQDRERKTGKMEKSGLSMEELERQQQLLFAASAARYDPSSH